MGEPTAPLYLTLATLKVKFKVRYILNPRNSATSVMHKLLLATNRMSHMDNPGPPLHVQEYYSIICQ